MINWKVRLKNKTFWLAIIPAVLMLIQAVAAVFGFTLDLGDIGNKLLTIVDKGFYLDIKAGAFFYVLPELPVFSYGPG